MSDDDRAPGETPPGGAPSGAPWVPLAEPGAEWPPPGAPPDPAVPRPPRHVAPAGLALVLLGLAALIAGHVDVSLYFVAATLYLMAQAADVHPAPGRLYAFLGWIPAATGALALGAIAVLTAEGATPGTFGPRLAVAGFAGLGAVACLVLLFPPAAAACARRLFRAAEPGHTLRLSATIVVATFWVGPSLWFVSRDVLAEFMTDPRRLVGTDSLAAALAGSVVLAFAAVGLFVRRDGRAALSRLGLTRPRPADALVVVGATLALWLLNAGLESFERAALPRLWERDSAFGAALAGVMGPGGILLLGLSAGVGEEITLRGALQPKLGILLTSLLFALLHVQYSWFGMLSLLLFGVLLGLLRRHRGTTVAIAVHALYDVIAVATTRP